MAHNHTIRDTAPRVLVRENVRHMSEANLNRYRKTVEALMAVCDDRGYGYMGTVHGGAGNGKPFGPMPVYCQHGTDNFLTWHRVYVYEIEQRLQDINPDVTVPYWDWTSQESIQNGIPEAFTDTTYIDPDSGETKPNPLNHWKNLQLGSSGAAGPCGWDNYPDTYRRPGNPSELDYLRQLVEEALTEDQFLDFTHADENPHNSLHNWVGGTMTTFQSSYDPIFWSHHANVDRQFWQWQALYGNSSIPESVLEFVCNPFGLIVKNTLNTRELGYTYGSSTQIAAKKAGKMRESADGTDATLPPTMHFDLGQVTHQPTKGKLHFHGLLHTTHSYEIRVYGNNEHADASTGRDPEQGFLGSLHLFGHGECIGDVGHCDLPKGPRRPFDKRPQHHLTPYSTFINITRNLPVLVSGANRKKSRSLNLAYVVLDGEKNQVSPSEIQFDDIELTFDY